MSDRLKKVVIGLLCAAGITTFALQQRKGEASESGSSDDATAVGVNSNTNAVTNTNANVTTSVGFTDGTFTGNAEENFYGTVQVAAVIANGKLTDVQFLSYPNDRPQSVQISSFSLPRLRTEAIHAQSASIDIVSGATQTSRSFIASLRSALAKS